MEQLSEQFTSLCSTSAFRLSVCHSQIQRHRVKIDQPWFCINTMNDQNNSLAVIHLFVYTQVNVSTVRKGEVYD